MFNFKKEINMTAKEHLEQAYPEQFGLFESSHMKEFAISFAKYHVEKATNKILEDVEIHYTASNCFNESVNKDSILNAYPLENIK